MPFFETAVARAARLANSLAVSQQHLTTLDARSAELKRLGARLLQRRQEVPMPDIIGQTFPRPSQTVTPTPSPIHYIEPPRPSFQLPTRPTPTPAPTLTLDQQIQEALRRPEVVGPASRIIGSEELAQVGQELGRRLGRPPTGAELEAEVRSKATIGPRPENVVLGGALRPVLQETGVYNRLPKEAQIPADILSAATSPVGLAGAFAAPAGVLSSTAGSIGLGEAGYQAEKQGLPYGQTIGELGGAVLGPLAEQRIAENLRLSLERAGGAGRLAAAEQGGTRYTPQEPGGPTPEELAFGQKPVAEGPPAGMREAPGLEPSRKLSEMSDNELNYQIDRYGSRLDRAEERLGRLQPSDEGYQQAVNTANFLQGEYDRIDNEILRRRGGLGGRIRGLLSEETGGTNPLPNRGYQGAKEIVAQKEETLTKPGKITQLPGIRQVLSGLNPSVSTERNVVVAANARQAAQASLETKWDTLRAPVLNDLKTAFEEHPPTYTGPKNNPIKGTLKDYGDNPEFYQATPELRTAAANYDRVSDQILTEARGQYGVNVQRFPTKEGGFYLPTVPTKESLDKALENVTNVYTSAGVSGGGPRARTRLYEGAYQRTQANPGFQPETNVDQLTALHDRALANMAGGETFKLGAGGKTRLEVIQETHPALAAKMDILRTRLASLRSTAGRVNAKIGQTIDDFLANPDQADLSNLADGLDVRVGANAVGKQGPNFGKSAKQLNAEINSVRADVRKLRPAWDNANLEPYVLNRKTFAYHPAAQSAAIDRILLTKLPIGDSFLSAIDETRLTAFGGDVSPLTIQGAIGVMVDPITGVRSIPGAARELFSGDVLTKVAQEEPEFVQRFTRATGRPFGSVGQEFVQSKRGIERIPGGAAINERLMGAVEYVRYQQWKSGTNLLQKLNPGMSENVADAEAANFLSKVVPALNPTERGASALQARLERTPVISTSFIGGPATFLKDAASGIAKLGISKELSPAARWQSLSGREQLAVLRGAELAGSLSTLSAASYLMSGYSPDEALRLALDPDPKNGRFLSLAFGKDFYVPIGGPVRSFVRGIAPQKVGETNGIPLYVPFANTPRFARSKLVPAVSRSVDLLRNKDYQGRKIYTGGFPENVLRGIWYGAEGVLPLSAGTVSEAVRTGTGGISDVARNMAGQLAGQDVRQASAYERLRRNYEDKFGAGTWDSTPSTVRSKNIRDDPSLSSLQQESTQTQAARGSDYSQTVQQINVDTQAKLKGAADAIQSGDPQAYSAYAKTRGDALAEATARKDQEAQSQGVTFDQRQADERVDAYLTLEPTDRDNDGYVDDKDMKAFFEDRTRLFKALTPEEQAATKDPTRWLTDPNAIAAEKKYQQAVDAREQFFNIPKYAKESLTEGQQIDNYVAQARKYQEEQRNQGHKMTLSTALRRYGKNTSSLDEARTAIRTLKRGINPERENFLVENPSLFLFFPNDFRPSLSTIQQLTPEQASQVIGVR